ncbi:MAG TPA: hypothetical protein VF701_21860, partial [Thermoanaerobaculia bacterium]
MKRLLPCLLFAVLLPLHAAAQEVSFPIESIVVRGARFASESVVRSETRLVEGQTYTEGELRQAILRVNRLPFVLDASFALEKGATHGSYILAVTIQETKPLFVLAESQTSRMHGSTFTSERFQTGGRWFIGGNSLVHASTDFENNYEAGYTQYNLFRRGGYAALNIGWTTNDGSVRFINPGGEVYRVETDVDPAVELRVGVPVRGDHSIVGQLNRHAFSYRRDDEVGDGGDQLSYGGQLAWVFDTTDDPMFPTSGTRWEAGGGFGRTAQELRTDGQIIDTTARSYLLRGELVRHHPVTDYVSLSYGIA